MSSSHLPKQISNASIRFDKNATHYFCCFGLCHAKTVGVLLFYIELIELIGIAVFLFFHSAKYTTKEWQSAEVLIQVAVTLVYLVCLAITTALLFMGVCYEEGSFILPYLFRQALFAATCIISPFFRPSWGWHTVPLAFAQLALMYLAFGTYRYFSELKTFVDQKSANHTEAAESSVNCDTLERSPSRQLRFSLSARKMNKTLDLF
jgi:magnesium-transporting ATPase (P-type)